MTHLGLVDLVTLVLVASSVVGALVGRRGLLGALLSGLGTVAGCWLVGLGLVAWAPDVVARAASSSAILQLVPVPEPALEQAQALGSWVARQYGTCTSAPCQVRAAQPRARATTAYRGSPR